MPDRTPRLRSFRPGADDFDVQPEADGDTAAGAAIAGTADADRPAAAASALRRHSQVFRSLHDAVLVTDLVGRVIDCNPAAEAVLGRPREHLLGTVPALHEDFPEFDRLLAAVWRDGEWTADVPFRRDDGEQRVGSAQVVAVYDDDGELIGTVGIIRDVTDERRIAVQLAQAERRWRLTLDVTPTGLALLDLTGRFVRVGDALCRITGYPEAELRRMTLADLTHPDDRTADAERIAALVGGAEPSPTEKRYRNARGTDVWVRESLGLARDPLTGRPEHLVAAVENITQQRLSTERLASILASCSDAFVGIDPFGQITEWNAAAETMFGWSRGEVLGQLLGAVVVPAGRRKAHREGLARLARGGESHILGRSQRFQAQRRDGELIDIELTVWRSTAATGEFFGFIRDGRRELPAGAAAGPGVAQGAPHPGDESDFTDPLTGLGGGPFARYELERALERQGRRGGHIAVVLIDVDGLEALNAELGRASGDELLVALAGTLQQTIRSADTAARYGGDEFLVLCEELNRTKDVGVLAVRLSAQLAGPYRTAGRQVRLSVSLGVAIAERRVTADRLLDAARAALNDVKRAGGDGYVTRHLH